MEYRDWIKKHPLPRDFITQSAPVIERNLKLDPTRILNELTKPKIQVDTQYRHKFDPSFTATVKFLHDGNVFYTGNSNSPGAATEAHFRDMYDVP